jgi:CO/xanthine dehydrogenase Mo-binding subunit
VTRNGKRNFQGDPLPPGSIATNVGNFNAAISQAAHTASGTFKYHYQGHTPIGPSCALADVGPNSAVVYSNTQNVEGLVTDLVNVLSPLTASQIRVLFYEGSGSYGNGCVAYDTAESAAIMSKAVGKPVRLQFMRWDEHGWTHFGPAIMTDLQAGIDSNGNMVAYQATQYTQGGTSLYTGRELLGNGPGSPNAAANALPPTVAGGAVNAENTSPWMTVASKNYQLISKGIPSNLGIFQSGPLRGPGAPQTGFANEQLMDMLAVEANMDPVAFRIQNIASDASDQRWVGVLQAAAQAANWQAAVPGSNLQKGTVVTGRGVAICHHGGAYACVIADLNVNKKTGKINLTHLYGAQDSGLTVNPNLVENQMVGNLIQGASRALFEEMTFNKNQITSTDWVSYPIMRFKDAPPVTLSIVQQLNQPSLGSGEPVQCPVAGAIANAFFDATGVRITEAPMTAARVRATLKAAGATA